MEAERRARLEALGIVVRAHGLSAWMTRGGLYVENRGADGCCRLHPSAVIRVRPRGDDGGRLWFFTESGHPFVEADRIADAVMTVKAFLNGASGVRS